MRQETVGTPVIMIAGASGTIGAYLHSEIKKLGWRTAPVDQKNYDLRNETEVVMALLTSKPDIVIDVTSSLQGGPVQAFRGTMSIGMNLIHACAASGIRLVQLSAPAVVWPWEDAGKVRAFLSARAALDVLRDAYVVQYNLNLVVIRLPMVYAHDARRADGISVIVANVCKAAREKADRCLVPFHQDYPFSMMHPSDTAASVAAIAASEKVGVAEVGGPSPLTCSQIVTLACKETGYRGSIDYGKTLPETKDELCPNRPQPVPLKISMEEGVYHLVAEMMGSYLKESPPPATAVPAVPSKEGS